MRFWWKSRDQSADLLAFEGEFITFQVDRSVPLGTPVTLEARLPEQEGRLEIRLLPNHEVQPDAGLRAFIEGLHYAPRRHIYCARLLEPRLSEPSLRILLESLPANSSHHHRLSPRLPRRVAVRSRDLPGLDGRTLDISLTGLSLRVDSALEPGRLLPLDVTFDEDQSASLHAVGRVCWCRPLPGGYVVGVHFESLTRQQQLELEDFVRAALLHNPLAC